MASLLDLEHPKTIFNLSSIETIQSEIKRTINLYQLIDNIVVPYYKPELSLYTSTKPIMLLMQSDEEPGFEEEIEAFRLICNPKFIPDTYKCNVTKECGYYSKEYNNFKRHVDICAVSSLQIIYGKQIAYGKESNPLENILESGYLPREAMLFRKTYTSAFDIECFEQLTNNNTQTNTVVHAVHKLLSIAVGDNHGFQACYVRDDSSHESALKMVGQFVDALQEMELRHSEHIPDYFHNAIDQIELDINTENITKARKMQLKSMQYYLEAYVRMDVFGFNSGMFQR